MMRTVCCKLYKDRLEHIGVTLDSRIHSTRLKDRLMAELSEFRAHLEGRASFSHFRRKLGQF